MIFTNSDAFLATPIPYPAMIRKSRHVLIFVSYIELTDDNALSARLLSVLSPHTELNTNLE